MKSTRFDKLKKTAVPVDPNARWRKTAQKMRENQEYAEITISNALDILDVMEAKNITQEELGKITGVANNQLKNVFISYKKTSNQVYKKIENALSITLKMFESE